MTSKQRLIVCLHRHTLALTIAATVAVLPLHSFAQLIASQSETAGAVAYTTNDDGSVTMSFGGQSPDAVPILTRGALAADQGVANSPFHGNYISANIQTVSFQIRADAVPSSARLVLRAGPEGRIWSRPLDVAATGDAWVAFEVPMSLEGGWTRNDRNLADKWVEDLANVVMIGIEIQRGRFHAQSYSVANFVLNDPDGPSGAATLSPLELALLARFGVSSLDQLTDAQRRMDSRSDGMSDWERILAEHDAEFARNLFKVRILEVAEDGVTIGWVGIRRSTYTVLRMDMSNPSAGLVVLPDGLGVDLPVEATGRMTFKDTTAVEGDTYAYAVRRNITTGE